MPYRINRELPASIKSNLPSHAQTIFRNAYNSAWEEYKSPSRRRGSESREAASRKVAWSAVKTKYRKEGDSWKKKSG